MWLHKKLSRSSAALLQPDEPKNLFSSTKNTKRTNKTKWLFIFAAHQSGDAQIRYMHMHLFVLFRAFRGQLLFSG
jgi:hypothetical protein